MLFSCKIPPSPKSEQSGGKTTVTNVGADFPNMQKSLTDWREINNVILHMKGKE